MAAWAVVGRERELAELDRVWAEAVAGAGCLLVLDGEAGIGKTALAVRLAETAAVAPVWVSCADQAVPAPQGVLAAVIAGLGLAPQPTYAAADGDARVVALASAFARAMAEGVDRPQLVVVDDVQWADEVSLRVLALAAPQVRESRVLVVATLRTGEALPAARRRAVAALLRAARRIPVVPLDDEAARKVVVARGPPPRSK
ncbi:MAG: ATP-binding protein, partial [Micromonosporaceae bacterium]|nr:ATP-binding protein [Micromonosporaceae bacterium]